VQARAFASCEGCPLICLFLPLDRSPGARGREEPDAVGRARRVL
jgi:hypothetical protein